MAAYSISVCFYWSSHKIEVSALFSDPANGGSSIYRIVSTELQKWLTAHHHANLLAYGNVSVNCQLSVNFKNFRSK